MKTEKKSYGTDTLRPTHTRSHVRIDAHIVPSRNCLYIFHGQIPCYLVTYLAAREVGERKKESNFLDLYLSSWIIIII